ncbi:MAG: hypothetical protein [Caudoviricetes sp.]|nr:MAG: hypothetical protein [Caudoviricetes sp.]
MKLSEKTMFILKNFQKINKSLVLKQGDMLMTKSDDNVLYAEAKIEETIAEDFAIYDLQEFINYIDLIGADATIDPNMTDLKLKIVGESGKKGVMNLADPSVVVHPKQRIPMLTANVLFQLKAEQLDDIQKASSVSGHKILCFTVAERDGKKFIDAQVLDPKDTSANSVSFPIQEYDGDASFQFYVNIENMKMIKSDYKIEIAKQGIITLTNDSVRYVIALESNSVFTE